MPQLSGDGVGQQKRSPGVTRLVARYIHANAGTSTTDRLGRERHIRHTSRQDDACRFGKAALSVFARLCTGVGNTLRLSMRDALLIIWEAAQQPKCRLRSCDGSEHHEEQVHRASAGWTRAVAVID